MEGGLSNALVFIEGKSRMDLLGSFEVTIGFLLLMDHNMRKSDGEAD